VGVDVRTRRFSRSLNKHIVEVKLKYHDRRE
jgi:hypothetical protein